MRPRAVIFDIDGTLLDSVEQHARAWVDAFADAGISVIVEAVRPHIGKGGDHIIPLFVPAEAVSRISSELEAQRKHIFRTRYLPQLRPFPRVPDLLRHLRNQGQRVVLTSSGKRDEIRDYKSIIGIEDLVDDEISSDDVTRSKPSPDIFLAALRKLAPLQAHEIVVVGDTPYDAEAAGKAGLRTIGLLCGGTPEAALRQAACIEIYRDPADLLAQYPTSPLAR